MPICVVSVLCTGIHKPNIVIKALLRLSNALKCVELGYYQGPTKIVRYRANFWTFSICPINGSTQLYTANLQYIQNMSYIKLIRLFYNAAQNRFFFSFLIYRQNNNVVTYNVALCFVQQ